MSLSQSVFQTYDSNRSLKTRPCHNTSNRSLPSIVSQSQGSETGGDSSGEASWSLAAKHYNAMGRALWLFVYLLIHANRRSGDVYRRVRTIAQDIGLSERTVQIWLKILRDKGYITTERTGRSLIIHINKWRPISRAPSGYSRSPSGEVRGAN